MHRLRPASALAFIADCDAVADVGDFICSETSGNEALTIDVPVAAAALIIAEDVVGIALRCMTHTNDSPLPETPAGFIGAAFAHALHNARVCMLCPQKLDHMVSAAVDSIDEAIRGSLSKVCVRIMPNTARGASMRLTFASGRDVLTRAPQEYR